MTDWYEERRKKKEEQLKSMNFKKKAKKMTDDIISSMKEFMDNPHFEMLDCDEWGCKYRLKNPRKHIPKAKSVTIDVAELGKGKRATIWIDLPHSGRWRKERKLDNYGELIDEFKELYNKFHDIKKGGVVDKEKLQSVIGD